MKDIANLLFEANHLKKIQRSGYSFLGSGRESVAEHTFMTTFVAYIMCAIEKEVDVLRLISMCLVHDLPESRIGDINYVQKKYVTPDESSAIEDLGAATGLGGNLATLISEFNQGETLEAQLARDADQIAFIIELKALSDIGFDPPQKWLPYVIDRLLTDTGRKMAQNIMHTDWDEWWLKNYVDRSPGTE
jgi:putative hydrolase of HD superfamily